jgi:predicted Fe-Mo cluster-binding NifX family protein
MKIAISAKGKDLDSKLDARFGRAVGFIIYDIDKSSFSFLDNVQNLEAAQGAGIQAAQSIVDQGVGALIAGHCGPKAFKVLKSAGVKIYVADEGTVRMAIGKYISNELKEIDGADVEGHWM